MEARTQITLKAILEDVLHDISNVVGDVQNSNMDFIYKKRNLTDEEHQVVYQAFLVHMKDPKPPHILVKGALSKVANLFSVSHDTIFEI